MFVQIRTHFLDQIQSGKLRPYDQIPSESELSAMFSVSRMTARKAIDQLVADHLIFRKPGKGTFVAPPPIEHRISTRQSFSAAMRALGLRNHAKVLRAGMVIAPSEAASGLRLAAPGEAVLIQRLRVVEDTPVAIHSTYLQPRLQELLDNDLTGSLTELLGLLGYPVAHTRDMVEAVVASDAEARLLNIPVGAPLARVEGLGYSSLGEPIFYSDGVYRGDWFRFTVDTSSPPDVQPDVKPDARRHG